MTTKTTIDQVKAEMTRAYDVAASLRTMACGDDDFAMDEYERWEPTTIDPRATAIAYSLGRSADFSARFGFETIDEQLARRDYAVADFTDDALLTDAGRAVFTDLLTKDQS